MFGKGAIIFVVGIGIIFSMYRAKLNDLILSSTDNYNYHYMKTLVHESAVNAMNYGVERVWENDVYNATYTIYQDPCTSLVRIYPIHSDTLKVRVTSRSYVFRDEYFHQNNSLFPVIDSVFAYFSFDSPISDYAMFTNHENGLEWFTGDTAWGPMHVNHVLHNHGSPVFYGKVTAQQGISPDPAKHNNRAKFYGGWEIGVDVPLPTNFNWTIAAAWLSNDGAAFNTKCLYDRDLTFEFLDDGTVIRTIEADPADTVSLETIAPDNIIMVYGDATVHGTLNGRVAILVTQDIVIEDDLVFAVNPVDDPTSDDFLTLISLNDIIIADNDANNDDCNLHGCIFASQSFYAENYNTRPLSGMLYSVGSIAQSSRGRICAANNDGVTNGFNKSYFHDPRFAEEPPPYAPHVGEVKLIAWWE